MSANTTFDITATSTLQAVASADEHVLISDLHKRVDDAIEQAEQRPDVTAAVESQKQAEAALAQLQSATRMLNTQARELRATITSTSAKALDKLIESAGSSGKIDYTLAAQLAATEHRERLTGRAIERVVEHLTPLALIARLRADSQAYLTRARAIESAAQQRAERLVAQLRDAVSDEVVLPVDLSKGVSGALLSHALELRRLAGEATSNADQIEKSYRARNGKE